MREWHDKYSDRGLTIVGVHAPEFEFEKDRDNVVRAVERYGLKYPVAQDNDWDTWRAFNNSYWPAKYLIGADGKLRYQHFGEGEYAETEQAIRAALTDAGWDVDDIPVVGSAEPRYDPAATRITRELYGGYERNYSLSGPYAGQDEYYEGPDRVALYEDVESHRDNRWYLQGLWRNGREAIVHARVTDDFRDYIALRFYARSVNVVLRPLLDEPFEVAVELDGRPLAAAEAGADVRLDAEGRSILWVDEPRLYAVVELPAFGEHELKLRANSDDFAVFSFTFGIYTEGP